MTTKRLTLHTKRTARCTMMLLLFFAIEANGDEKISVNYDDHIAPIFRKHCFQCHGESKQEAGLNLASFATSIKGGSGGEVLIPERSNGSRLFQAITAEDPAERMPPNNDPLPADDVAMIRKWIDTGLKENRGSAAVPARKMNFVPSAKAAVDGPAPLPENLPALPSIKLNRPFPVLAVAASPRGELAAIANYERIDFINTVTRTVIGSVPFPEGEPHVLRFNSSGTVLLAAGGRPVQHGSAVLYNVKMGSRLAEIGNETDAIMAADISPDEKFVAVGGSGRAIKVFSTSDGTLQQTLVKHTDWITAVAYSPDGKLLASADRVGNIHLWDATSGGVVLPLSEHKGAIKALAWRSDSQILASCGEDGLIVWWEISKGWPAISKPEAHPPVRPAGMYGKIANGVLDASFSTAGELVTCGRDGQIRIWSADGSPKASYSILGESTKLNQKRSVRIVPLRSVFANGDQQILAGDSAGQLHWQNVQ
ncbi:MAG: hypothetical protein NT138_17595 [Planctomycetales bacterium]|nr:hypothetical protein [Planctomycetales bacterium]